MSAGHYNICKSVQFNYHRIAVATTFCGVDNFISLDQWYIYVIFSFYDVYILGDHTVFHTLFL